MTSRWGRLVVPVAGLLLALVGASTAIAAELEEILVTAERRQSDLQKVPIAVTAFTADEIDNRQIIDTLDLIQNVPNLTGSHNVSLGGSNSYFLRGIGNTESIATFDVPIGTYIDEIYLSRQNQNQVRLFHTETLEVLRGPQGQLFGRNTTGGAIVVTSQKPQDEFSTRIEGGAGNYDRYFLRADVDVPIADKFLTQFNGYLVNEDGWMDSVTTGESYNGEESWGLRGAFRFLPTDSITWDLSAQYSDVDVQAIGVASVPGTRIYGTGDSTTNFSGFGDCSDSNAAAAGIFAPVLTAPVCSFNSMEALLVASNFGWDIGPVMINFITGWYDLEHSFSADFLDNSPFAPFGPGVGNTFTINNIGNHEQFSQEIKFTGEFADGRVAYVGGLFYMDEDNSTVFSDWIGDKPALFPGNNRNPLDNGTESFAVYGQFDFGLGDTTTLQLGGRWTDEDKDFSINGLFFVPPPDPPVTVTDADLTALGIPLEQSVSKFTPRVALLWEPADNVMTYVSYTEGFKSGGWNARGTSAPEFAAFGPEEVTSYEWGLRTQNADNSVRVNVTAFRAEYDEIQIATVVPMTTIFITQNAGDSRVTGLEVEFQALPTENLSLYGNLGLMDAKFTRLSPAATDPLVDIGPDPVRTPDANGMLGFTYTVPPNVAGGSVFFGAQATWEDDYFMGNSNGSETLIDAHTLVNAQLGWRSGNGRWETIVECKNCLDEEWFGTNLFTVLYTADPVRYGVRVNFKYN